MEEKILVIGSNGQVGSELIKVLRQQYGTKNVLGADVHFPGDNMDAGPFIRMDILNKVLLEDVIKEKKITQIYALAAMLSATAERNPEMAWQLNMQGLLNVLELARIYNLQVFWPSSIAVFGPDSPKVLCPQQAVMEPRTVYGISKVAGELWCQYYFEKFSVDVRSIRYPGLISYETAPGGGTTDYAIAIFHEALQNGKYTCFLSEGTRLPMMYMPDAIRATVKIMQAPAEHIKVRTSYNIAAMSFSPGELAGEIRRHIRGFKIACLPDYRQQIAESWPQSIKDTAARKDWGWQHDYDLEKMTADMLQNIRRQLESALVAEKN